MAPPPLVLLLLCFRLRRHCHQMLRWLVVFGCVCFGGGEEFGWVQTHVSLAPA
jgi:hypothetical protein